MSRVNSLLLMGGAGYSGAYIYNNKDLLLDEVFQQGFRGYNSPSRGISDPASIAALQSLSQEIAELKNSQYGHNAIILTNQPSTVLGLPLWKAVGLVGTLGTIYFKVKGYEMRDLVYVSKKHFTTVTDSLREQFDVVQQALEVAKVELVEKVHLVEAKIHETREALEVLIGLRVSKVEEKVDGLTAELNNTNTQLSENTVRLEQITEDLVDMKSNVSSVASELDSKIGEVHSKVGHLRQISTDNFLKISSETNSIDQKIERLSDQTNSQLLSLQQGIEESQKGISLLCEYVSARSGVEPAIAQNLQTFVQSNSKISPGPIQLFHRRSILGSGSLSFTTPVSGV